MKKKPLVSASDASSSSCLGMDNSVLTGHDCNGGYENSNNTATTTAVIKMKKEGSSSSSNKKKKTTRSADDAVKPRSSIYRGVTRHRWTGRFEAHLWDKTTWNPVTNKKGRQIYLGAYKNEEDAARTHDLAALKYWGIKTTVNFPVESYEKEIEEMKKLSKSEYLASLRRESSGFSRGVSKYRGVARHHHNGRWEARIGRVQGSKYLYLGTFGSQEEAAMAYDRAAIEYRGIHAVTNFDISNYADILRKFHPNLGTELDHIQLSSNPENSHVNTSNNQQEVEENGQIQPEIPMMESHESQVTEQDIIGTSPPTNQDSPLPNNQQEIPVVYGQNPDELMTKCNGSHEMTSMLMDPIEEYDHPWNHLYWDMSFKYAVPLADIPLDQTSDVMLGWLDHKKFEDNIECIFDEAMFSINDGKPLPDEISGTEGSKVEVEAGGVASTSMNEHGLTTSGSSSSLSTMASVCSNVV